MKLGHVEQLKSSAVRIKAGDFPAVSKERWEEGVQSSHSLLVKGDCKWEQTELYTDIKPKKKNLHFVARLAKAASIGCRKTATAVLYGRRSMEKHKRKKCVNLSKTGHNVVSLAVSQRPAFPPVYLVSTDHV